MAYSLTLGTIAFLLAVIWGRPLINLLRQLKLGKRIRIEQPSRHQTKTGTPTMGGLMILVPVLVITTVLNVANLLGLNAIGQSVLVPMGVMITFGTLGAIDDLMGIKVLPSGLLGRYKLLWQVIFAFVTAIFLHYGLELRSIAIPGIEQKIDIGWLYIPVAVFIIVGTSNAVNLTDGLDGLAGSIAAVAFSAYGVIAFLQGQIWLVAFSFTVVGAVLAFLWFNAHPAELFMGDTGSLALGATLAVVALMTGQWLLLPVVGFVFMAEVLSVILQVAYFKLTGGKRIFRMSPLHNHFELVGWSETHITQRFWLVGILSAMLGIALALI
ncbi:MAG: phospho-N-acetylmuramoyl-pentapeptide-transferase [Anaerolineae bacterium]|nr:phospho-N-acetylmuramoyl-pentapeptide-transferase [Anaerolineae bacterium]